MARMINSRSKDETKMTWHSFLMSRAWPGWT